MNLQSEDVKYSYKKIGFVGIYIPSRPHVWAYKPMYRESLYKEMSVC